MSKENKQTPTEKKTDSLKTNSSERVPFLIDFSLSLSRLVIFLIGVLTTGISIYAGASISIATLRGCLAMISIGLVAWLITWFVSRNALEVLRRDINKVIQSSKNEENPSTVKYKA